LRATGAGIASNSRDIHIDGFGVGYRAGGRGSTAFAAYAGVRGTAIAAIRLHRGFDLGGLG
jgi:hypothetical protein